MKKTQINKQQLDQLYESILKLNDLKQCRKFFRDLCTLNELSSMSERLEVAKLINQGIPYRKIAEQTGSSTATITRIAHWLNNGEGGYKLVL